MKEACVGRTLLSAAFGFRSRLEDQNQFQKAADKSVRSTQARTSSLLIVQKREDVVSFQLLAAF